MAQGQKTCLAYAEMLGLNPSPTKQQWWCGDGGGGGSGSGGGSSGGGGGSADDGGSGSGGHGCGGHCYYTVPEGLLWVGSKEPNGR